MKTRNTIRVIIVSPVSYTHLDVYKRQLLAHEVGAGKTFEMAASAMEAKRLGLCQKSQSLMASDTIQICGIDRPIHHHRQILR